MGRRSPPVAAHAAELQVFHHRSRHRLYSVVVARRVLPRLLHTSYFSASDDAVADSHDTRRRCFREDATHMAITLLATEDQARKHIIAEAVWREILWVMPRYRQVSIKVNGGKVAVEFGPESPALEGMSRQTNCAANSAGMQVQVFVVPRPHVSTQI